MFPLLIPLLSTIFSGDGPIGQYFKTKAATQKAASDLALKVEEDKMSLSGILAQAAVDSEKNKLAATSQSFKAISFFLINVPIIITCISRDWGIWLWTNMGTIPVWYAQMYVSVVFVIWGLPVVANATGIIFQNVQEAWAMRQDKKIDKITAINQANTDTIAAARKDVFDTIRKATGIIGLTQVQVDALTPMINKYVGVDPNENKGG